MQSDFFPTALLPDGRALDVRLTVANDTLTAIQAAVTPDKTTRLGEQRSHSVR